MDGKLLASAKARLEQRVSANEAEQRRRQELVYSKAPEMRSVEAELRSLVTKAALTALQHGGDVGAAIDAIAQRSLELQQRRRLLLLNLGLAENYLDEIHTCAHCHDKGYVSGEMCICLETLYRDEARKSLSNMLNITDADFDRFDLSYYSDQIEPGMKEAPRARMRKIFDFCRVYAQNFRPDADSLLMQGGTGLGKTFLSSCIARTVAEQGFSVVYETAAACIGNFEAQKFARNPEELDRANEQVRRYLGCELMILDDLGTEMAGGFAPTALYTLINTRLASRKATIISTNLSSTELRRRYSEQIVSRLEGEYQELLFFGTDIRKIKKGRKF